MLKARFKTQNKYRNIYIYIAKTKLYFILQFNLKLTLVEYDEKEN